MRRIVAFATLAATLSSGTAAGVTAADREDTAGSTVPPAATSTQVAEPQQAVLDNLRIGENQYGSQIA